MNKAVKYYLLSTKMVVFVLSILLSSSSFAQDVRIKASADKKKILIGDQISFRLQATFNPQKFRIQFPKLTDTFNRFEIVERNEVDTALKENNITLTQNNVITNFDSGVWVIPSQQFSIIPLDGSASYDILSDSMTIMVNTIDADTSKPIKPIFDIIAAKKPWWEAPLYFGLALLFLILLIGLIWYYFKHIRSKVAKPKLENKVYIAPWDNASKKILSLESKELWLNGEEKNHHTQLTDIIRTYIEDAFGLDCFEKTSQEIVTDVKKYLQKRKYKKRGDELDKLRNIFFVADLVKFAKSKPTELEHEQSNQAAKSFIQNTGVFLKTELLKQKEQESNNKK